MARRRNYYFNVVGNVIGAPGTTGVYEKSGNCTVNTKSSFMIGYADSSCSAAEFDTKVGTTLLRHGNHDAISGTIHWTAAISDHTLPSSLFRTSKPAFFGCRPWPPIGSDLTPMVGQLPAKDRYDGVDPCSGIPSAPTNLKVL